MGEGRQNVVEMIIYKYKNLFVFDWCIMIVYIAVSEATKWVLECSNDGYFKQNSGQNHLPSINSYDIVGSVCKS